MKISVETQKMASAKSLEDMLSSEVDESVVNALVGSLESQLSSPNIHIPSQDINSGVVTTNHIGSTSVPDPALQRLHDGQKHSGVSVGNLNQVQGNPKTLTSNSQIVGLNSVASSAANAVMVTLAGALPASGYITQVTAQQGLLNSPAIAVNRPLNNADIKIVYSPQQQFNSANSTVIQTQRSNVKVAVQQNGSVGNLNLNRTGATGVTATGLTTVVTPVISGTTTVPGTTAGLAAMQNLANVASQQAPLIISSSSPTPVSAQNFALQTTAATLGSVNSKPKVGDKMGGKLQTVLVKDVSGAHPESSAPTPVTSIITQHQMSPAHQPAVMQVTSATPTVITVSKPVQSQQGQVNMAQVMSNPNLLPGVQILNVNHGRPGTPLVSQKTLAPRVMIGNQVRIATASQQVIATRPGAPGVQNTITLQQGMVRGTLLFKAENGQLQVLNVTNSGLPPSSQASSLPGGTTTYRFQSVQPGQAQGAVRALAPQQMTVTLPVSVASGPIKGQTVTGPVVSTANVTQPLTIQTSTTSSQSATTPSQMSPNTAKKKCKNFLSTLIRLATDQPEQVATNVKNLIQGLIDGAIQPEEFTNQLQKELNSSPQPCLVPFLKKSLPYLRHSLMTKELTIEGVRPPAPGAVTLPPTPSSIPPIQINQPRVTAPGSTVRVMTPLGMGNAITTQLAQSAGIITQQRLVSPRLPVVTQTKSLLVTSLSTGAKTNLAGGHTGAAILSPATVGALQSKVVGINRTPSVASLATIQKDKEKRNFTSLSRDDDDINDVAAMGGVNLMEESQRILASNAEIVGTQIRSCKDENFLFTNQLQRRINSMLSKHGLGEAASDVVSLISHATQERLKGLVEKLGVIAEHRLENIKGDHRFEVTQDVRGQLKFLEELDRLEKKRHEEQEREILLRAAKSRSKLEDPEQLKLKQKAKEMQRAEMEEMRTREANMTALLAIGPRKKLKMDGGVAGSGLSGAGTTSGLNSNSAKPQVRPRVKRVNLRDLLFLMEQERDMVRSLCLYKSYMK